MKPILVKDAENLKALAEELKHDDLKIIWNGETSFSAYKGGKIRKVVKIGGAAKF